MNADDSLIEEQLKQALVGLRDLEPPPEFYPGIERILEQRRATQRQAIRQIIAGMVGVFLVLASSAVLALWKLPMAISIEIPALPRLQDWLPVVSLPGSLGQDLFWLAVCAPGYAAVAALVAAGISKISKEEISL